MSVYPSTFTAYRGGWQAGVAYAEDDLVIYTAHDLPVFFWAAYAHTSSVSDAPDEENDAAAGSPWYWGHEDPWNPGDFSHIRLETWMLNGDPPPQPWGVGQLYQHRADLMPDEWSWNSFVYYSGSYYECTSGPTFHTATVANGPEGVSTYWTKVITLPVPEADPWYGHHLTGTYFITEEFGYTLTGSFLVAAIPDLLVWRIAAFDPSHDGYDDLEDILSDCGVTFG